MSFRNALPLLTALSVLRAGGAAAQASGSATAIRPHAMIQLVSEGAAVMPGRSIQLALRFTLEPGWHIYWENPGTSGIATRVTWRLPTGFTAGPLRFPVPEVEDVSGIRSHVHHGDFVLLSTLTPPAVGPNPSRVVAEVRYGICRDVCISGNASVTITLPWTTKPEGNPAWAAVQALADARAPRKAGAPPTSVAVRNGAAVIRLEGADLSGEVAFFPADPDVALTAVTVPPVAGRRTVTLTLPLAATAAGPLRGVLLVGGTGYEVSLPLKH